jgi:hypothetical protein
LKRIEPNLLLALSTGLALLLVLMTTVVYGPPIGLIRNPLLAVICAGGFVLLNPRMLRMMRITPRPPLIYPGSASTVVWAAIFPLLVIAAASVPVFWPGHDYGLLVIIASVWFGATLESAIKASRRA